MIVLVLQYVVVHLPGSVPVRTTESAVLDTGEFKYLYCMHTWNETQHPGCIRRSEQDTRKGRGTLDDGQADVHRSFHVGEFHIRCVGFACRISVFIRRRLLRLITGHDFTSPMLSSTSRSLRLPGFQARFKHTVRVILTQNVGEKQAGEVLHVSAGYARNMLIPKKMALYAIADNFERLGRKDPDIETEEERRQRLIQMAADEANVELIAANILQKYLRNKLVSEPKF